MMLRDTSLSDSYTSDSRCLFQSGCHLPQIVEIYSLHLPKIVEIYSCHLPQIDEIYSYTNLIFFQFIHSIYLKLMKFTLYSCPGVSLATRGEPWTSTYVKSLSSNNNRELFRSANNSRYELVFQKYFGNNNLSKNILLSIGLRR